MQRRTLYAPIALLSLLFGTVSTTLARDKEPYCKWKDNITAERLDVSDAWLYRAGDPRIAAAIAEHIPFGLPEGRGDASVGEKLLAQPHFLIWYDTDLRAAIWTAHHLTHTSTQPTKLMTSRPHGVRDVSPRHLRQYS